VLGGDIGSGRLEFELNGKKLKGIFVLAKMKGKDKKWLLIKKRTNMPNLSLKSRQS